MSSSSQALLDAGRLAEAVAAQNAEVRARPTDPEARVVLFCLLVFAGDLERAGRQLEALGLGSGAAIEMRTLLYRGLLAAEAERRQIWDGRARPLLAPDAPPGLAKRVDALARVAAGDPTGATRLLDEANALSAGTPGSLNGARFDQIRDTDDLGSGVVELFAQGRCLWLGFEQVRRLELKPPESLLDLVWAPARLSDARGNEAVVHLPTLYAGSHSEPDDQLRLGRTSEWREVPGVGARGVGQKVWLTAQGEAEQEWGLLDVRSLEIEP